MKRACRFTRVLLLGIALAAPARIEAQTAHATLSGQVRTTAGVPVGGARVFAENQQTATVTTATTNATGQYVLAFLPAGAYSIRIQAPGYRPVSRRALQLHVAAQVSADFELEALTADQRQLVRDLPGGALARGGVALIYDADAQARLGVVDDRPPPLPDATSSTLSEVLDQHRIRELPLAGRDAYTLFVLLPGVTSDNATRRGLGFSVHGFRVSSSNYLLDGVDNNDLYTTASALSVPPEGIEEYRLATANFSAEYGRGAFVANVMTRSGSNQWHGSIFDFSFNDKLNANDFQANASGQSRLSYKEHQFGATAGGPLRPNRAFFFAAIEAMQASVESTRRVFNVVRADAAPPGSVAAQLLAAHPVDQRATLQPLDATRMRAEAQPRTHAGILSAAGRLDVALRPDRDDLMVRFTSLHSAYEDVVYSPYRGLGSPFFSRSLGAAAGHLHRFNSGLVNEFKIGFTATGQEFLPASDVPQLLSYDGTFLPGAMELNFDRDRRDRLVHLTENLSLLRARHHLVLGGEFRDSANSGLVAPGRLGHFFFAGIPEFLAGSPLAVQANSSRPSQSVYAPPDYFRLYRQRDAAVFVQDNWRFHRRVTLNLGLRWESFGVPRSSSADLNFYYGPGTSPVQRVAGGQLRAVPGALYQPDRNNFAPRAGFAIDLLGTSRLILRGGYGVFYDRLFNLLWESLRQNAFVPVFVARPAPFRYTWPVADALAGTPLALPRAGAGGVERTLRTPYVQTWFLGLQQAISRNAVLEINHAGTTGRKLATRDVINRGPLENPDLGEILMLTNQGSSTYTALTASLLRRFAGGLQFQASYTWSHAIDNQSDPLIVPQARERGFQREFDAAGDRGNAEFDQRHNAVFHALWQPRGWRRSGLHALTANWQIAGIAAVRSGFPLTVVATSRAFVPSDGVLILPRADYVGGPVEPATAAEVAGGRVILDRARFANPAASLATAHAGNLARGALRGPGFWNCDLSIARRFSVPRLSEGAALQLRADFFNVLNHANLDVPDIRLDSPSFGVARYGRRGARSIALGTSPLNELARRIQIALRLNF